MRCSINSDLPSGAGLWSLIPRICHPHSTVLFPRKLRWHSQVEWQTRLLILSTIASRKGFIQYCKREWLDRVLNFSISLMIFITYEWRMSNTSHFLQPGVSHSWHPMSFIGKGIFMFSCWHFVLFYLVLPGRFWGHLSLGKKNYLLQYARAVNDKDIPSVLSVAGWIHLLGAGGGGDPLLCALLNFCAVNVPHLAGVRHLRTSPMQSWE